MEEKRYGVFFETVRRIIRVIIPKYDFEVSHLEGQPVVYVSHHQNMIGPVSILVWIKNYVRTWGLSVFTEKEACYNHFYNYTLTERFGWPKPIANLSARILSYIVPWLAKSARIIPVYRESRKILETMKISVEALMDGEDILIFPDVDYSDDSKKTSEIYEGFLHLEKYFYRETEEHLTFVPVFSDNTERVVRTGKKIQFTGDEKFIDERKKIASEIREELNRLAKVNK